MLCRHTALVLVLILCLPLGVYLADKSNHDYVPLHEVLGEKEAVEALKKFGLEKQNLPRILVTDPQVVKLGARSGQVVRIHRNDNGNKYFYYRLVVDA